MASVKKNVLYLLFSQLVGYIFPLLTLPYLSHKFEPAQFGVLGICQAIVQYFIIVTDYGFNITGTRQVSINRDDKVKVSRIFFCTMSAKLILLALSSVGIIIAAFTIPSVEGYSFLLICCFTGVIGNAFFPLWLFQGIERIKIPVILSSLAKLLLLALIFVLVKNSNDLNLAAVLLNGGNLLAGIMGIAYIYRNSMVIWVKPRIAEIYCTLMEGWPVFLSTVAISFYTTFNIIVLGYHTSNADVGYYNAADRIRIAIQSMFGPITQAFYPRIVHLTASNKDQAMTLINKGIMLMLLITLPCAFILFFYSDELIVYYLSEEYRHSAIYLKYLSFLPVVIALATAYCNWGLLGYGESKLVSKIYVTFGLIHILYSVPLISLYKVEGVITSVYITQILITLVMCSFFYLRIYNKVGRDE
ncbi:flippase [Enterobacteriaceae bacterium YMB-R22]|uniref:flippase n=1 Tax=Tenebrionicola larvae TaxID=2815733 RepID=UPI002011B319|nr:flippase [Tenebrionicola larvae]MBV4412033.1 flippase [Tenebrionicola larvae]